jgi:protein involved in polysaccharide export with SLBB domain
MKPPLEGGRTYQPRKVIQFASLIAIVLVALLALIGCETPQFQPLGAETNVIASASEPTLLREGDVVSITFPGAPNLNTRAKITDGKISLPWIGEVTPVGKTVSELEKELLVKYDKQLVRKEVKVTLESASFSVVVSGPGVMHPGPLTFDHPTTLLQAVMQAVVDFSKAKLTDVKVIRTVNGRVQTFKFDLDKQINGKDPNAAPFYLKPGDSVIVPERWTWF